MPHKLKVSTDTPSFVGLLPFSPKRSGEPFRPGWLPVPPSLTAMAADVIGAILIGGSSRRMGSDKVNVELAGKRMVDWVGQALVASGLEVITVGGPDRVAAFANFPDPPDMLGPLAGLTAALQAAGSRPVVLVAVDPPLVRVATIEQLAAVQTHDAVVPIHDDYPQVTCALYRATCLPSIRRISAVNPEASIRDLLQYVNVRRIEAAEWAEWGEDGRSWRSIDTPQDLHEAEADDSVD